MVNGFINQGSADNFIDWVYQLTQQAAIQAGINERQAATVINTILSGLQREFGGNSIYISSPRKLRAAEERQRVLDLKQQGLTIQQITRKTGFSRTKVYDLLRAKGA